MNLVREIPYRGMLPCGLILNATIPDDMRSGLDGVVRPDVSGYAGPIPTNSTSISLRGRFLHPVIIADVSEHMRFDAEDLSQASIRPMVGDPFSDPVMLMSNVFFDGYISVYSDPGRQAKLPAISAGAAASYALFKPVKEGQVVDELICAPALACDVYIPSHRRKRCVFGVADAVRQGMMKGIVAPVFAHVSDDSRVLYEDCTFVTSGTAFYLPTFAHEGKVAATRASAQTPANPMYLVPATLQAVSSAGGQLVSQYKFAFSISLRLSSTVMILFKDEGMSLDSAAAQQVQQLQGTTTVEFVAFNVMDEDTMEDVLQV